MADIVEVRWARTRPAQLDLLATFSNPTDASRLGVLVLADTDPANPGSATPVPGTPLQTERFDQAVLLRDGRVDRIDLGDGSVARAEGTVVIDAAG